ncbi:MAG: hypothetical protein PHW75_03350 [Patescibacteria group bacterium]|nr:hypothetical protein [Patescibacteria group bacterium]
MKSYIYAALVAILISFIFGTLWYTIFGFDPYISVIENVIIIYTKLDFWKGLMIWAVLYGLFLTFPITFLKNRVTSH